MTKRILLVDKDADSAGPIEDALASRGHDCRLTLVIRGLENFLGRDRDFNLIIFDPRATEKVNVLSTLIAIKQKYPETPLVIFTADLDPENIITFFRAGAIDCLLKSSESAELAERLAHALSQEDRSRKKNETLLANNRPSKQLTELLMALSHDVRSPLLAMLNRSKLLLKGRFGAIDERAVKELDKIDQECNRALGMADEYLDKLFSIYQGKQQEKSLIDLGPDVIDPILDELTREIQINEISVTKIASSKMEDVKIQACPVRLKTVFRNLLTNAIKYGGKRCQIGLDIQRKLGCYRISIYNNGPAITEDKCYKLFSTSSHCRNRQSLKGEGAGVGLNLAREIILQHGGDLWYENIAGKPHFVFTLPHDSSIRDSVPNKPAFGRAVKIENLPGAFRRRPTTANLLPFLKESQP